MYYSTSYRNKEIRFARVYGCGGGGIFLDICPRACSYNNLFSVTITTIYNCYYYYSAVTIYYFGQPNRHNYKALGDGVSDSPRVLLSLSLSQPLPTCTTYHRYYRTKIVHECVRACVRGPMQVCASVCSRVYNICSSVACVHVYMCLCVCV